MTDRPVSTAGEKSYSRQEHSASLHASASLRSLLSDNDRSNNNGNLTSSGGGSRRLAQNNLTGSFHNSGSLGGSFHSSNDNNNYSGSTRSAGRRGRQRSASRSNITGRRGRSPPQPRAERSASRLHCPNSAEESDGSSGSGGDGSSGGAGGSAIISGGPSEQVGGNHQKVAEAGEERPAPTISRRRGRRRQRHQPPPPAAAAASPPPDRAEAVASPTYSADSTGLYFYRTSTRSPSADTRNSAEQQLLSIAQALQRQGSEQAGGALKPRSSTLSDNHQYLEKKEGDGRGVASHSGSGSTSASGPRVGASINAASPPLAVAASSPARSRASRTSRAMSAATRSQITDGGWSTGTGSSHGSHSEDGSESFVSWNESEHGSLPSHHRRARDAAAAAGGGGGDGDGGGDNGDVAKGRRWSSATNRLLTQLGVGAVPFDASVDRQHSKPPISTSKPAPAMRSLSSSERAQRLMDEAQRNVQVRRSKQMGLFGGYEREVPATSSAVAGQQREEGTSRGSSSGPSAVARVLMDSLQDVDHEGDGDDSTADGCYVDHHDDDDEDYDDVDDDDRSAEASVHRLWGRVGIARPAYPFSFGEDDSRDRSEKLDPELSERMNGEELQIDSNGGKHPVSRDGIRNATKTADSSSSKSSWISGSVSLDDAEDGSDAKVDDDLKKKLGLGSSKLTAPNCLGATKVEKEYDPFDLGSSTTTDSGPVKPPRWLQNQAQDPTDKPVERNHDDSSSSSSSSPSESSSSGSYTSGSSSESSLPAEYIVAEPGWDKGSVADSSIKSITAQLRSTVQEEAIREAGAGAAIANKPEKLPVYKRMYGRGREQPTSDLRQMHVIPSIREDSEEVESPMARKLDSSSQQEVGNRAIHDPFDLRSSVGDDDEGPQRPPVHDEEQCASSLSSSTSSSSSESSYTEGSSSVDTPPARMVVTKEDWATGSVAESSIKSITAPMRAKVSSLPEKLPAYGKPLVEMKHEVKSRPAAYKSASEPSLEPLYVGWGSNEADDNGESSHEGGDNYQAWPDSPQKLRKCPPKPRPDDVDSIQKGWVIVCIENIISPEKADEQEMRAKRLSTMDHEVSSSGDVSSSPSGSESASGNSSGTNSSESDVVRKELTKREEENPNIVHEEQRAVGNLSAMWEAKANKAPDDPTKNAAVVQSRKQAQERIGAFRLRRNGAITLQSAWRSYCARKRWQEIIKSVISIQNAVRTRLLKAAKNAATKAALLIQSCWRSFRKQRIFVMKRKSACLVQSAYRGHIARQSYRRALQACVKLQALSRGNLQRLETSRLKEERAATLIQAWCRYQLAQKTEAAAACRIQAAWRGHVVLQRYRREYLSIVKTQAVIRGGLQRKQFSRHHALLKGVVAIQSIARGAWERSSLEKKNKAALCIQNHYRSYKASETLTIERTIAATAIQSATRHYIFRRRYQELRCAAIVVQAHSRRVLAATAFRRSVRAITVIQALARGIACRRQVQQAHELRALENKRATTIQTAWRGYFAREAFHQTRLACLVLQSTARGYHCRQTYSRHKSMVQGFTSLQAFARGSQERRMLQRQAAAARYLQSWWRKCAIAAEEENVRSATCIASWWRVHSARKSFAETREAAIVLQSATRGFGQRRRYRGMLRACVMIQAFAMRATAKREHEKRLAAAILIQRTVRCASSKRALEESESTAAIILQSSFRSMSASQSYARQRAASISIQAALRGSVQRTRFEKYRSMVLSITAFQAVYRGVQQRKTISKQSESATIIASKWRSHHVRETYLRVIRSVILLQSVGRRALIRQSKRREAEANVNATIIATKWRSHHARFEYLRFKRAVILLQAVGRGTGTRHCKRRDDAAATSIQCAWRSYYAKGLGAEMRRKEAATKLQSIARVALARSTFRRAKLSAVCIQRQSRGWIERERFARYMCLVRGAISFQALARGVATRRLLAQQNVSARSIQQSWRIYKAYKRQEDEKRESAAVMLQASCRRLAALRSFQKQKGSAVLIQSTYRMSMEKARLRNYTSLIRGIVILQSIARGRIAKRSYEEKRVAAVVLQAWYRSCRERDRFLRYNALVRSCIALQALFRGFRVRGTMAKRTSAAISIQQAWKQRQSGAKGISTGRSSEANLVLPNKNDARAEVEELTPYNSLASSADSSSGISQYLRNECFVAVTAKDQASTDASEDNDSNSSDESDPAVTKYSSSDASYDEDRVRQALVLGAAACGAVPCVLSTDSNSSQDEDHEPDLVASDEQSSESSTEDDGPWLHGDLEAGMIGQDIDSSSMGSSHLSDYFDDDLPPASRKISSGQTAGASSEASPKRNVLGIDKKSPSSSSCCNSSSSSEPIGFAPTVLPPVVEESFDYDSEDDEIDLEANVDNARSRPSHTTPGVDERRMDCVVQSSHEKFGSSSIRARAEDLARQNTLLSARSLMGSSSNLSSCFLDDDELGNSNAQAKERASLGADAALTRPSFQQGNNSGKFNQQRKLPLRPPQQGPDGITSVDASSKYGSMEKEVSGLTAEASLPHTTAFLRRESPSSSRATSPINEDISRGSRDSGVETSLASSMLANEANRARRDLGVSTAGQSTFQREDKSLATGTWPASTDNAYDIEQGVQNDIASFEATHEVDENASDDSNSERANVDWSLGHGADTHQAKVSNMEGSIGSEKISLIDHADADIDIEQSHSSNPTIPAPSRSSSRQSSKKPPRHSAHQSQRPHSSTLLPMYADNTNDAPLSSENKIVSFYRGHRSWCYIFGLVGVLALIAGVVVAFTVDFGVGNNSANAAGVGAGRNDSSPPPSIAPTLRQDNPGSSYLRPSPPPTAFPSRQRPKPTWVSPVNDADYQRLVAALSQVSNEDAILDATSPQNKAFNWIAGDKRIDPFGPFTVQRYILALLYFSTNGDSWSKCGASSPACSDSKAAFLSDENECSWHGVSCNDDGFLIGLDLDRVGMEGALPEEIGSLSYLERLVIPRNRLSSTVPSSLASLKNLLELDLFDNELSGTLPKGLSQLPLKILQISTNKFTGSLPPIFNPDLEILDVSANTFSGTLPKELFDTTTLKEINLSMNQFSGTLSRDLDRLTQLRKLLIGLNSFSGVFPDSIGDLKSLESLHATYNDLTGTMPNSVCELFDYRLKRLSTDCAVPDSGRPTKIVCSCCTLCLEGDE